MFCISHTVKACYELDFCCSRAQLDFPLLCSSPVVIVLIYSVSAIAYDVTLWLRFQKGFQSLESPTFYDLLQDCILSQTIVHFQCTVFLDSKEIIMPFKGNNCVRNCLGIIVMKLLCRCKKLSWHV